MATYRIARGHDDESITCKPLNILSRGDLAARSLGINTSPKSHSLFLSLTPDRLCCRIAAALVLLFDYPAYVAFTGNADHRFIIPGSVLLGGSVLMLADMFARTIAAPAQLPVGIITAIIGVPLFYYC